jgi:hypothetical protein
MKVSTLLKIQTASHLIAFFLLMLYAAEHRKYILALPSVLLLVLGFAGIMAIGPQRELEENR